jgi:hypothetical protein
MARLMIATSPIKKVPKLIEITASANAAAPRDEPAPSHRSFLCAAGQIRYRKRRAMASPLTEPASTPGTDASRHRRIALSVFAATKTATTGFPTV